MKCANWCDNIIFDEDCLGLECKEVKAGHYGGPMVRKIPGTICSICSSSCHFNFLNIESNIRSDKRILSRNREFLRYFIGVSPAKFGYGLERVNQDDLHIAHFVNDRMERYIGVPMAWNSDLAMHFDNKLIASFDEDFDEDDALMVEVDDESRITAAAAPVSEETKEDFDEDALMKELNDDSEDQALIAAVVDYEETDANKEMSII